MSKAADTSSPALAGAFSNPSEADWLAAAEKALGGRDPHKALTRPSDDGVAVRPLYTRADGPAHVDPVPGFASFTRGAAAARPGWAIRQTSDHPDPAAANAQILADLEGGATDVALTLDLALDGRGGRGGIAVASLDDLDRALAGVHLDLAPVALDPGAHGVTAAAMLAALWQRRGLADAKVAGAFNIDPMGTLAAEGSLPVPLTQALAEAAHLGARTDARFARVTALGVDSGVYHAAGAGEAQELAAAIATGVAYLRAMEAQGLPPERAGRQIAFTLAADTDVYLTVAKLRAARRLWHRVMDACGAGDVPMALGARTAERMLTRRDPWVNLLRATLAGFAAATGGADWLSVSPHDAALGGPDDQSTDTARRIARNVQVILAEESRMAQVIDPAGGAWAFEALTDELAQAAWVQFQTIEAEGGIARALETERLQARIAETARRRDDALATRKHAITGVSEFADPGEELPAVEPVDGDALRAAARERAERSGHTLPQVMTANPGFEVQITALTQGATPTMLIDSGEGVQVARLARRPLAAAYEALRDRADAHVAADGRRPAVFLAALGPLADHGARVNWARNALAAGGLDAPAGAGTETGADAAATLAQQFKDSGCVEAVLCGSDAAYEAEAEAAARALKAAGCRHLTLAGKPGDRAEAWAAAGVDAYLYLGCDILAALGAIHDRLGEPA
ncbi:heterodimeric methylmalonyl-CoA mutase small subunit [Rhodothalassium salexigens DSM 2132]|uniref:Heterodimeric methylmalonyl-CoA mutase small subunit n=1 Tax=Rhodothalassium salexigens DSM 2132 TaxID=1188247 RepID=A0A4R2PS47_RHOSA|nr:methylmalonyl-CoA mutase family protein [Rhodothalassium salexigens]MBB4210539.1 methylmalonyl-CoA mutase [Rhodothalassium salexigens DSM 2132]MBK1638052.1 hypothetical protein [Rhodothalassium salexigens DSM 2132]TCP37904.1 heterodimeric methylmalonyl-CoA mutase small subunit [Rhodothalassium salexigens DSM 2132]